MAISLVIDGSVVMILIEILVLLPWTVYCCWRYWSGVLCDYYQHIMTFSDNVVSSCLLIFRWYCLDLPIISRVILSLLPHHLSDHQSNSEYSDNVVLWWNSSIEHFFIRVKMVWEHFHNPAALSINKRIWWWTKTLQRYNDNTNNFCSVSKSSLW